MASSAFPLPYNRHHIHLQNFSILPRGPSAPMNTTSHSPSRPCQHSSPPASMNVATPSAYGSGIAQDLYFCFWLTSLTVMGPTLVTAVLPGPRPAPALHRCGRWTQLLAGAADAAGGHGWPGEAAQTLGSGPAHGASPSPVPSRIAGRGLINIQSCFQV